MTLGDMIRDENLKYNINKEAVEISASSSSSGKIDNYEFLTGEQILTSDQSRTIEPAKITYSPVNKAFEKQIKTIKGQGIKQVEALRALKREEKYELDLI